MSKIDEIRSEMVAAMKAGDKERKAALSFLLSSLKNKAIDKKSRPDRRGRRTSYLKRDQAVKRDS